MAVSTPSPMYPSEKDNSHRFEDDVDSIPGGGQGHVYVETCPMSMTSEGLATCAVGWCFSNWVHSTFRASQWCLIFSPPKKNTQSISLHHDFTFPNSKSKDTAPGSGAKLFVSLSTRQQKEKETGKKVDVLHYYIFIIYIYICTHIPF